MLGRALRNSVRFAVDGSIMISGPPGTVGLRWPLLLRAAVGGVMGRLYHVMRFPFHLTPLVALPFALLGAYLHHQGLLWAGVFCSFIVASADVADGVAQGYVVDPLPPEQRPRKKMRLRKTLDSFVVDPTCRFLLYGVFALRLHEEQLVPFALLIALLLIELSNNLMAASATCANRSGELFYEFVLDEQGAKAHQPFYHVRVLTGHLSAYHGYSVFPLIGYLLPLSQIGLLAFGLVFSLRAANFIFRLKGLLSPTHPLGVRT